MESLYSGWLSHPFLIMMLSTALYAELVIGVVVYGLFALPKTEARGGAQAAKPAPAEGLRKAA
ncbi:MAG: hypothetical protein KGL31_02190 [candidate division NC10 bacterium]|nr:hypothetical protein [candidate division NC10 bacterium]MDE2320715.1 hypothetical protein [candidate division NC10 bacterium]